MRRSISKTFKLGRVVFDPGKSGSEGERLLTMALAFKGPKPLPLIDFLTSVGTDPMQVKTSDVFQTSTELPGIEFRARFHGPASISIGKPGNHAEVSFSIRLRSKDVRGILDVSTWFLELSRLGVRETDLELTKVQEVLEFPEKEG